MKMLRKMLHRFCLGVGLLLIGLSSAFAISPNDLTIAIEPVVDQAGVISADKEAQLNAQIRRWHEQGIMQAAVVVVDSTDGMAIFDYTLSVAERWGLGDKERDDGLMMVIAVEDRDLYILTGYGLEGVLPDISIKRIIREDITPQFKQGNYGGGIELALNSIVSQLKADPETQQAMIKADKARGKPVNGDSISLLIPIFLVASVLSSIFGRFLAGVIGGGVTFGVLTGIVGMNVLPALLISFFLGGMILLPFAGAHSVGRRTSRGGFGRGGFGGGGFGGGRGGFGGGGGGFGGGGAGGSW